MLILSRRPGEVIRIGDNVQITVISTHGNAVRLGISAPKKSQFTDKRYMKGYKRKKL